MPCFTWKKSIATKCCFIYLLYMDVKYKKEKKNKCGKGLNNSVNLLFRNSTLDLTIWHLLKT